MLTGLAFVDAFARRMAESSLDCELEAEEQFVAGSDFVFAAAEELVSIEYAGWVVVVSLDGVESAFCGACGAVVVFEQPGTDLVFVLGWVDQGDDESAVGQFGQMDLGAAGRCGLYGQGGQSLEVSLGGVEVAAVEEHARFELKLLGGDACDIERAVGRCAMDLVYLNVAEFLAFEQFSHFLGHETDASMLAEVDYVQANVFVRFCQFR